MTIRELVIKMGFDVDDKAVKNIDSRLANVAKTAGKITLGVGAALTGLGAIGLKTAMDMESLNAQFTVMLGSGEKAAEMTKSITKFAASTPFAIKDLSQGAVTLLNFGLSGEKILPTMRMLGDVAGNDSNKLKSLALVFGQIQSTGKLMGGDLLQLINAGFNPLQELSKSTGKSMSVLKDEMSKGAISADMVTEAFRMATSEGGLFFNNMETQSKTLSGMLSTLKDNVGIMLMNIMTPFVPIVKDIVGQMTMLMEGSLGQLLSNMMNAFAPVLLQIIPLFAMLVSTIEPLASEILADFMPAIGGLMNSMLLVVQMLLPLFGFLLKSVSLLLKPVLWLLDGFFLMDKILGGGLTAAIMGIVTAFILFTNTVKIMNIVIAIMEGLMSVNPFVWIALAVIALIGLIGLLIKHWDKVVLGIKTMKKIAVDTFNKIRGDLRKLIENFGLVALPISMIVGAILNVLESWDKVKKAFAEKGLIAGIVELGKAIFNGLLLPFKGIIDWFKGLFDKIGLKEKVEKYILNPIQWVRMKIGEVVNGIKQWFKGLFDKIGLTATLEKYILNPIRYVREKFMEVWDGVSSKISEPFRNAVAWIGDMFMALNNLFNPVSFLIGLIQEVYSSWDSVKHAFTDGGIGNALLEIGKALLRGVLNPIRAILDVASKIPGVGGFAKQGVQKIDEFISGYLKKTEVRAKETEKKVTQSEQRAIQNSTTNNNVGMTNSFNINANGGDAGSIQSALQQSVRAMFQLELKKVINNAGY